MKNKSKRHELGERYSKNGTFVDCDKKSRLRSIKVLFAIRAVHEISINFYGNFYYI